MHFGPIQLLNQILKEYNSYEASMELSLWAGFLQILYEYLPSLVPNSWVDM